MSERLGSWLVCPSCGERVRPGTLVAEQGDTGGWRDPDPGDRSVCSACGAIAVFERDFIGLRLRAQTPEEAEQDATDHRLVAARTAVREVRRRREDDRARHR